MAAAFFFYLFSAVVIASGVAGLLPGGPGVGISNRHGFTFAR